VCIVKCIGSTLYQQFSDFDILKSGDIAFLNGKAYKQVVHMQGNIVYFNEFSYILYAIGEIVAIIIVNFSTLFLLVHPVMMRIANYFQPAGS